MQRSLVTVTGLAGLVSGGLATFQTDNQAGSVALIGVGSVAALLALVGKVPLKWVIGGHEFDMSEEVAQETVDAITAELDPGQTAELSARLKEVDRAQLNPMTSLMQDVVEFEQTAIGRVKQALVRIGDGTYEPSGGMDKGFDGYVALGDVRIPVEYKMVRNSTSLGNILQRLQRHPQMPHQDLLLILSGPPITSEKFRARIDSMTNPFVHPLFMEDVLFEDKLAHALAAAHRRLVSQGESPRPT